MIKLILFLIALAAFSYGAAWFLDNRGEVHIVWQGYEIETSMMVVVGAAFTLAIALVLLFMVISVITSASRRVQEKQQAKKADRGLLAITSGFSALAIGDDKQALQASKEARKLVGEDKSARPLALMLSAESEQMAGNHARADEYFQELLEHKPTEFAALKGLLVNAEHEGDATKALGYAERAYRLKPQAKGLSKMMLTLYKRHDAWDEAQLFLNKQGKSGLWSWGKHDDAKTINVAHERAFITLMQARKVHNEGDKDKALKLAEQAHKHDKDFLPPLLLMSDLQVELGQTMRAKNTMEKLWKLQPTKEVGQDYMALYRDEKPKKRIKRAERLASQHPNHAESNRVLAEAHLAAGTIEKAKEYGLAATGTYATASLCALMQRIEEASEPVDMDAVKEWKLRAEHGPADPSWICSECGYATQPWEPVCPQCDAIDSMEWRGQYHPAQPQQAIIGPADEVIIDDA